LFCGIFCKHPTHILQQASVAGVFGLSFWVFLTNLFGLRAWVNQTIGSYAIWAVLAVIPYFYGIWQIDTHTNAFAENKDKRTFKAMLVQTAFPIEEADDSPAKDNMVQFVIGEWQQIAELTKKHQKESVDLIVLPEFVVPFGTYAFIYPLDTVVKIFSDTFGPESLKALPPSQSPYSSFQVTSRGPQLMVNNAYWVQGLANYFKADVLAGLEDAEDIGFQERLYYSSAMLFHPLSADAVAPISFEELFPERYDKRILVPMGEYIPFTFCKNLAAHYGVFGSFTCGTEAKVMSCNQTLISPSICYEETFGDLIREGRQKGAQLLVNLTSDAWYPNSRLPQQHFDHARLRTVENGVPLIRACNTGITGAIDSLGRTIAVLGGNHPEKVEWVPDSLVVEVPINTYSTLYSRFGDSLLIGFCFLLVISGLFVYFRKYKSSHPR